MMGINLQDLGTSEYQEITNLTIGIDNSAIDNTITLTQINFVSRIIFAFNAVVRLNFGC